MGGMVFVPEGQADRSQARSAWESPTPKDPSRWVRYDRARLIPSIFLVEMCLVLLRRPSTLLETSVSDVFRVAAQSDGPFPEAARYRDGDGLRRCQGM